MDIVPIITKKVTYKIGVLKMASVIDGLVEQLGKLTVIEAGELSKKLEKVWNLDLAALTSAPAPIVEEIEAKLSKVVLLGFEDGKKIPVIQKIRQYREMGLLEAKTFVENTPSVVKEDLEKEEADKITKELESVGGKVEIK
jgi:large subunit ribosomal protein L7/L12